MLYLYVLGLLVLLLASIFDIKTREVPDTLVYSFIAAAFFTRILFAFQKGFVFLTEGILGMIILGIFGVILFYLGQWGGADAKLMIGLGCVLGFNFILLNPVLIFLACVVIAGAIYGLFYMGSLTILHFSVFKKDFVKKVKKNIKYFVFLILLMIISVVFLFFFKEPIMLAGLVMLIVLPLLLLLLLAAKSLEKSCFRKLVSVEKLTEGDWLVKNVEVDGKIKVKTRKIGLLKADINKLIALKEKGLIGKVEIKTGMPFVPVFFFAFILFLVLNMLL